MNASKWRALRRCVGVCMSKRDILSLDRGATSSRAMVIDVQGASAQAQREFRRHFAQSGWGAALSVWRAHRP